ncbi:hypothetical protein [Nocardia noduli]|uniref:hypothetical protein n=1 Tax=Nocardia noduli TaxID=2815722 RepID=UPI001C244FAB|nr:hypothetical protein [Nocardia noduli]
MNPITSSCRYRRGNSLNSCDIAIASFTPDKWLASTGQVGHLFDGLSYLLQAAQEWQLQTDLKLEVVGYPAQAYAMDSVFLRSRSLFEFFVGTNPKTHCHASCLFGLSNQIGYAKYKPVPGGTSSVNPTWEDVLHVGSMHLKDRNSPVQLIGHDGALKDLNQMPVDFAKGILDVWGDFETELNAQGYAHLHSMAEACRDKAKEDAGHVFDSIDLRAKAYRLVLTGNLKKIF